jgi:hypothetical protein
MNFTSRRETDGISYLNPHAPSTQALLKTRIICRLGGAVTDVISVVLTAHENCRPLRLWRLNSWRMSLGAISESAKCVSRVRCMVMYNVITGGNWVKDTWDLSVLTLQFPEILLFQNKKTSERHDN